MRPEARASGHGRHRFALKCVVALAGLPALAGCATVDGDQARLCRIAIPAIEAPGARIVIERVRGQERGVRVEYRTGSETGSNQDHFAECRFAIGRRTEIEAITTDRGEIPGATVYLLRRYYVETPEGAAADPGPPGAATDLPEWPRPVAVFAQHLLAGAPGAAILSLLAAAFGLVWGLVGRIHLAFGPLAVVGAVAAGIGVLAVSGGSPSALGLVVAMALGIGAAALHGLVVGRWAFEKVPAGRGQASLIATVGLAMALSEYLRLAAGSHALWIGPVGPGFVPVARSGDFIVTILPENALVAAVALLAGLVLVVVMRRTRFGLWWEAVAQDDRAASLAGIDVRRLLRWTLLLSGALAGLAGALSAIRWGALGFSDGLSLGLKALTGAILGGIGSVPAALAGGLLVGLAEILWRAVLPGAGLELALFIGLVIAIMLRPSGLFARS